MDFETYDLRNKTIETAPHVDFDSNYNFYYDETNNPRTVYVREDDFNASIQSNFVLGGILDNEELIDFGEFKNSLKLQNNINEIKFKHIASGTFSDCLKSKKLNQYFTFVLDSEFDVHFSSLNTLYFGITDIVDSAVLNAKEIFNESPEYIMTLKDTLYQVLKMEIQKTQKVFFKYKYPNVEKNCLNKFISDLIEIITPYREETKYKDHLAILINVIKDSDELVFLEGETDFELLKDFSHFYLRPIYLFNKSTHVFDKEDKIEKEVDKYNLLSEGVKLQNYSFEDSKDSIMIQLSDVFVGILGKLSTFINSTEQENLAVTVGEMNNLQRENLKLLFKIISISRSKNPGFVHWTSPISETLKTEHLERIALS
tara:strand:+ start:57 stop:1169 length:1113 start_codon:yes stop_codon:yes gene_type:complete